VRVGIEDKVRVAVFADSQRQEAAAAAVAEAARLEAEAEAAAAEHKAGLPVMLLAAAKKGDDARVSEILAEGAVQYPDGVDGAAFVNVVDEKGYTALYSATMYKKDSTVAPRGSSQDRASPNLYIHGASQLGARDKHFSIWRSPIEHDSRASFLSAHPVPTQVALLLEAGAEADMENNNGVTPLMAAARDGCTDIVKQLLAAGADYAQVDEFGRTADSVAEEKGFSETSAAVKEWASAHPK
jgi:ankyrin repeat protein